MSISSKTTGFTLVEIALALMVVSVGLLAVFSLFPAGMAANKQAIDDTYGAMFAEELFYGYRAQVSRSDWEDIRNLQVPARSADMWAVSAGEQDIRPNSGWQTVRYIPAGVAAIDFAVRYNLVVEPVPGNESRRAYATLEVLFGEVGPTNNPIRFYTEFLNTSM